MTTSAIRRAILAGLSLVSISTLAAAETAWQDDPIVVTANRTEQRADSVPARVSVIDRQDIERSQAPDLLELLRLEAGIDIARNGGPGGQTSVFMRGANSNHVLVLIDGVRVAASGTGAFTWEVLDPAVIERIEIVRGPRAARWGSDAIGGVIQIFTRRAEGLSAAARYASDNDRKATLSAGRQQGDLPLDLTLSGRKVDGFSAQNPRGFAFDPDDDGFENFSAATGGSTNIAGGALQWRGRAATGETEFDRGETEFDNWSWRFDYRRNSSGPWQWQLGAATVRDRLETETAFGSSEVVTRRLQGDWLAERILGDDTQWLLGVDAWRESGVSRGQWNESRSNVGVFSGLEGAAGRAGYELSLRVDEDEDFGTEVTGNAGVNWRFDDRWRAFASAGRAFRAPNFSQLFSPGFGGLFAGNPDLDPERSWSAEAGLDFNPGAGQRLTLSAYSNWIDDLIDFSGVDFRAVNVKEARIRGLEFSHGAAIGNWTSKFNLTWQDPEDRDADRDLLRRAEFKGNWVLGYAFANRWNIDGELVHVGDRLDVGGARLSSYTLINLRAAWRLRDHWNLEVRVDNLADRDYEPLVGFNAADRRVFVQLGWSS
ncbi:MAG: TonB-dependent receptor [Wenzhouxiangellaceae bacterium]|nr:TonB-dependent receptor [Wenzhouxiangellaceae bacterium]MBS3746266.1 TonB-dependent receptor [Wenzhouxiangellaceae bacterium]